MGMKANGVQLKGNARKLYVQAEKLIMHGRRTESFRTKEALLSSARQLALSLSKQGPQNITDFKPKHASQFIQERISAGINKGQLSKDQQLINFLYKATGRPELVPNKNPVEVRRTMADRNNPKTWDDPADRMSRQEHLEERSERYGLAARNSMENGTRRAESLASRWVIVKEDGRYYSNWGTKNPADDMQSVTIRQIRYMYATDAQREARSTPKDFAFENKHLDKMKDGQAYLYVGRESKNGTKHLVPLEHDSQFQVIKSINKFCTREGTKTLAPADKTMEQAIGQFARALRNVGITKSEANYTLHVDRHEYVQRSTLPDQELINAVGHSDVRKLDSYRPK